MRRYFIVGALLLFGGIYTSRAQLNMTLLGGKTYANELNDIWGYVDSLGNEYALVGVQDGISVVDVTDPANPTEIWWFNGPSTTWRDLKVWNKHCYVTNEASQGLFIIDLSGLPDVTMPATANYTGSTYPFGRAHNLFIDENGVAYVMGSNYGSGGAIMLDVNTDPMNPIELGVFDTYYLHDGMVRGDTLWGAAVNNGFFVVVSVLNKSNPIILNTQNTPSNFTHNCWISDDGDYLYTTDETSNAFIASYDVSNPGNIKELDRVRSNPGSGTIPHNTHFMNEYLITSYYRDGVTVHDVTFPDNVIEVANYDTYAGSGNGFNGAWGVYPWLPSGNIIVSNIEDGLTVHGVTYVRGCYLEGTVTDLFTFGAITNATITILGTSKSTTSGITGGYKTGLVDANTYNVAFSAPGYISDTLSAILTNGVVTIVDVQLSSQPSFTLTGSVQETSTGNPIANAEISIVNSDFTFNMTSDGSGNFTIPTFFSGTYDVIVGKWLYITNCSNSLVIDQATGNLLYSLDSGLYDDFSFDFGWTVNSTASTGFWEIGEPLGTTYNGDPANPEIDVQGDCGDQAYVTGNSGTGAGDDDIDDGMTTLTSPIMNLMGYTDPYLEYYSWFFNAGGFGAVDDTMRIYLSNGTTSVLIEEIFAPANPVSWVYNRLRILDSISLSDSMTVVVEAADAQSGDGHLVEAGFDMFQIYDSIILSTSEIGAMELEFAAVPNPFSGSLEITYNLDSEAADAAVIEMRDVAGRIVFWKSLNATAGTITIDAKLAKGVYFVQLVNGGEVLKSLKVVKA